MTYTTKEMIERLGLEGNPYYWEVADRLSELSASPWVPESEEWPKDGQVCLYRIRGVLGPCLGEFDAENEGFTGSGGGFLDINGDVEWAKVPE